MATVYLARDRKHDRPVAIKIMRPEIVGDQGAQRFTCKFWLRPLELARGGRFPARELLAIERRILQHLVQLEVAWDEHCGA